MSGGYGDYEDGQNGLYLVETIDGEQEQELILDNQTIYLYYLEN